MADAHLQPVAAASAALDSADAKLMLGTLRQLRAGAQYVDGALAAVVDAVGRTSEAERRVALDHVARSVTGPLGDGVASVDGCLAQAKSAVNGSPYLRDWLGDELVRIELLWDDVARNERILRAELAKRLANSQAAISDSVATAVASCRLALREVILAAASAAKDVGEPCAGEPHARFDGRELETERGHGRMRIVRRRPASRWLSGTRMPRPLCRMRKRRTGDTLRRRLPSRTI
jgi:hypothetical protein